MAENHILRPGDLFFLTERGIAQSLAPSSPVQKIETYSTGSFSGHPNERWSTEPFKGFHRTPTTADPFMLIKDYSWISVAITNTVSGGLAAGTYNDLYQYTYSSAALFVALFGDKKVAFAIWLKKDQVLEDLVVAWKNPEKLAHEDTTKR